MWTLRQARWDPVAIPLDDGKILVVGGVGGIPGVHQTRVLSTEILQPEGGVLAGVPSGFPIDQLVRLVAGEIVGIGPGAIQILGTDGWRAIAPSPLPSSSCAVALADGGLFLAGGWGTGSYTGAAHVWHPATQAWRAVQPMSRPRSEHAATRLGDGRVMVTGGIGGDGPSPYSHTEIWDPTTDCWQDGPPFPGRRRHSLHSLDDGRVLLVGGVYLFEDAVFDGDAWKILKTKHGGMGSTVLVPLSGGRLVAFEHATSTLWDGKKFVDVAKLTGRTAAGAAAFADDRVVLLGGVVWPAKGKGAGTPTAEVSLLEMPAGPGKKATPKVAARSSKMPATPIAVGVQVIACWAPGAPSATHGAPARWSKATAKARLAGPAVAGNVAVWGGKGLTVHTLAGKSKPRALERSAGAERVALAAGGKLAAASWEGSVALWELKTGKRRWLASHDEEGSHALAISPAGDRVACGGEERQVRMLSAADGKVAWSLDTDKMVWSLAFSPDGKRLAIGDWNGDLRLADAETGEPQGNSRPLDGISSPSWLAWDATGKRLLVGNGVTGEGEGPLREGDVAVALVDVETWKIVRTFAGPTHPVTGVAFAGGEIVAASEDGTLRWLDSISGKEQARFTLPDGDFPTALAISGEGDALAGTRSGAVVRLRRA